MRLTSHAMVLVCAAVLAACAAGPGPGQPASAAAVIDSTASRTMLKVPASPEQGFNYPYLLRLPATPPTADAGVLLVEPNNTGHASDRPEDHLDAAKDLAITAVGADVSRRLGIPLLVPVFPRTDSLYTHILNRRTLATRDDRLHRIDLQVLAMVDDARRRLAARGLPVREKVLMTGFSASGAFVNRFVALHPTRVLAAAAGAVNGMLILPRSALGTDRLPFPIGVADLPELTGQPFDLEAWKRVPQFLYMGADDTNDAVQFDDAYTAEERSLIYRLLGEAMQPDRWEECQRLYREAGAPAAFTTYQGIGHATNGRIHADIAEFFTTAVATPAEQQ